MRKLLLSLSILSLCLSLAGVAGAVTYNVLNTGNNGLNPEKWFYDVDGSNGYAGKFTTTQTWKIEDMQGYFDTTITGGTNHHGGVVNINIYTYDPNLPATTLGTFLFGIFFTAADATKGWQGTTGYAGTLPAGSYWISFEIPSGSTFYGKIGSTAAQPDPMLDEAYHWGKWNRDLTPDLSARIAGLPVPLPGAVWLLGSGLLGLVGWRRFGKG